MPEAPRTISTSSKAASDCQHTGNSPGQQHIHQHINQHDDHHHHDHGHAHGHGHLHFSDPAKLGLKLKISTAITVLFVIAEVIAGLYSGSLALLSDAAHNFTDALSLLLAFFAIWLQQRPANLTKTYGYHRAGILAAFINSSTLMFIVIALCYSALDRIFHPRTVETGLMFWVALIGLLVNTAISLALHRESKTDITIRSAYLHMLGDAASTVGIIIGSVAIHYTGYTVIDPLISIVIGAMILWTSWDILKETVNLLLEGTPRGIDVDTVKGAIQSIPGVRALHHIHIWGIASRMTALSCHLEVDDMNLSRCHQILRDVNAMLKERFRIEHATLQIETKCAEEELVTCKPNLESH